MDLDAIVQDIEAELCRLEKVRVLLTGHTEPLKRGMPSRKAAARLARRDAQGSRQHKRKDGQSRRSDALL